MCKHSRTHLHTHTDTPLPAQAEVRNAACQVCTRPFLAARLLSDPAEILHTAPSSTSPEKPQPLGVWEAEPDTLPAGGTMESMTQVDFCSKSKGEGFFHPVTSLCRG